MHPALFTVLLVLLPSAAFAHTGHDHSFGFSAGFIHALSGVDHVCVMLGIGIWASRLAGWARLSLPMAFLAALLSGACAATPMLDPRYIEAGIMVSLLALSAILVSRLQVGVIVGTLATGCFALFHGLAHGTVVAGALRADYIAGLLLATATLHCAGLLIGAFTERRYRARPIH